MVRKSAQISWIFRLCILITILTMLGCDALKGPQGPEGEKGDTGMQGKQGDQGFNYYFDNFNRSTIGQSWTIRGNVLTNIVDNRLQMQGTESDYLGVVGLKNPDTIADFTLEIDANQISMTGNGFGILFRDSGANKQYRVVIDAGYYAIFRGIDHLNTGWKAIPGTNTTNSHRITVRCISSLIECYIDNYPVFIGEDNTYSNGSIALCSSYQTIVQFDNFKLQVYDVTILGKPIIGEYIPPNQHD